MCEVSGLSYADLLSRIIILGFERYTAREALQYSFT